MVVVPLHCAGNRQHVRPPTINICLLTSCPAGYSQGRYEISESHWCASAVRITVDVQVSDELVWHRRRRVVIGFDGSDAVTCRVAHLGGIKATTGKLLRRLDNAMQVSLVQWMFVERVKRRQGTSCRSSSQRCQPPNERRCVNTGSTGNDGKGGCHCRHGECLSMKRKEWPAGRRRRGGLGET